MSNLNTRDNPTTPPSDHRDTLMVDTEYHRLNRQYCRQELVAMLGVVIAICLCSGAAWLVWGRV